LLLSASLLAFSASAAEINNLMDGQKAYCPGPQSSRYLNSDKLISMKIEKDQLVIQAVTCTGQQLQSDQNLKRNEYKTVDGVLVSEVYTDYELIMQSEDLQQAQVLKLAHFEDSGVARVNLKDLKKWSSNSIDINIQSRRQTKASSGYADVDFISWGSFRLRF
jgi:hypothetical protein